MNFCPGKLFLKLLAQIGEWHQNLSEKTVSINPFGGDLPFVTFAPIHNKQFYSTNKRQAQTKFYSSNFTAMSVSISNGHVKSNK